MITFMLGKPGLESHENQNVAHVSPAVRFLLRNPQEANSDDVTPEYRLIDKGIFAWNEDDHVLTKMECVFINTASI